MSRQTSHELSASLVASRNRPHTALEREAPSDGPIALYRQRSLTAIETPPPPEWDGVHVMMTK